MTEENNSVNKEAEENSAETNAAESNTRESNTMPNDAILVAEAKAQESHENYLRALAEFENYKKRALKDRSELLKYQGESLVIELLNVFDNLELALQHKDVDAENLRTGLEMTHKGFLEALKKFEIRPETAVAKPFDPATASAISKIPASEAYPAGTVVGELKKPFFYKDKLIRFGEVIVAVEPD